MLCMYYFRQTKSKEWTLRSINIQIPVKCVSWSIYESLSPGDPLFVTDLSSSTYGLLRIVIVQFPLWDASLISSPTKLIKKTRNLTLPPNLSVTFSVLVVVVYFRREIYRWVFPGHDDFDTHRWFWRISLPRNEIWSVSKNSLTNLGYINQLLKVSLQNLDYQKWSVLWILWS